MNPAATTEAATTEAATTTIAAGVAVIPTAANPITIPPLDFFMSLLSTGNKNINQRQNIPLTPSDFLSRKGFIRPMVSRDGKKNIRNDITRDKDNNTEDIITYNKRICLYASAQALRLANTIASTHYQYASAIASSTAELQAVNEYENIMAGFG